MPPFLPTKTLPPRSDFTILPFPYRPIPIPIPISPRAPAAPQAAEQAERRWGKAGYVGALVFFGVVILIFLFCAGVYYRRWRRAKKEIDEYHRVKRATRHLPGGASPRGSGGGGALQRLSPVPEAAEVVHPTFESKYRDKIRNNLGMRFSPTVSSFADKSRHDAQQAWSAGAQDPRSVASVGGGSDITSARPGAGPATGGGPGRTLTPARKG